MKLSMLCKFPLILNIVYNCNTCTGFCGINKNEDLQNKKYLKEHCLQAEYSSYAQECKKNGGHFKCCSTGFRLDKWHLIRHELKKRNLIEKGPQYLYCGNGWSGDKDGFCYIAAGRKKTFIIVCQKIYKTISIALIGALKL